MYDVHGKVAVVTGAGSGIGRALALNLAARGCRLALADISERGLAETAALLPQPPLLQTLDVADRDAVYAFAARVARELGGADVVVNNAGVALSQTIEHLKLEDFEWLMGINFWGVVHGTQAFLPQLKAKGDGAMVNISSIFGIVAMPTQGAYHAAKFAVRGFTECLRQELEMGDGKVFAVSVHPGGIKTNIARNSRAYVDIDGTPAKPDMGDRFEKLARTTAEEAARVIVSGIERRAPRVLIGADARLLDRVQRLMPVGYPGFMRALLKLMR